MCERVDGEMTRGGEDGRRLLHLRPCLGALVTTRTSREILRETFQLFKLKLQFREISRDMEGRKDPSAY